ncbi:MAG: alpha/beta hydrolase, partial [Alphaproteobacteria bacterium]
VAFRSPERVTSLISAMSTSGDPSLPPGNPKAREALMAPLPEEHEALVAHVVKLWQILEGSRYKASPDYLRQRAETGIARCHYPIGAARQMAAAMVSGPNVERLQEIDVPTLVIHGRDDPLIPLAAGESVASLVPGAQLVIIDGMGHEITPDLGSIVVSHVVAFTGAIKE